MSNLNLNLICGNSSQFFITFCSRKYFLIHALLLCTYVKKYLYFIIFILLQEYIDIMEADIIIDNHTPPAFGEHNYINSKPLSTIDHTFNKTQPQTTCGEHTFNQTLPLPTFGNQSSKSIQPSFSLEKYPRQSSASPPSSLATSAPSSVSLLRFIPTGISEHLDMVKSPALYFVPDSQKRWDEPGKKLVSIVPKPEAHSRTPVKPFIFTPTPPNNIIKSDRKCRKVREKKHWKICYKIEKY